MSKSFYLLLTGAALFAMLESYSQKAPSDSNGKMYRNVIRYNLSGALLFGVDKYIVFGYERVLSPRKSISVNFGSAAMPRIGTVSTDSFHTTNDGDRKGYNASIDYRFYLGKENKYYAPHGLYIGPYYSYNHFSDQRDWEYTKSGTVYTANTNSSFTINTIGFELGYQFIIGKHFALDLLMVGPGLGFYRYKATINSNLTEQQKALLRDALKQTITEKFPGMNYVFEGDEIQADGTMNTTNIGYRYIIHIGYNF